MTGSIWAPGDLTYRVGDNEFTIDAKDLVVGKTETIPQLLKEDPFETHTLITAVSAHGEFQILVTGIDGVPAVEVTKQPEVVDKIDDLEVSRHGEEEDDF